MAQRSTLYDGSSAALKFLDVELDVIMLPSWDDCSQEVSHLSVDKGIL